MLLSKSRCFLVSRTHCHLKTLDIYPSPENSLKNLSTCLRFASQKKFQSMKVLELMQFRIMVCFWTFIDMFFQIDSYAIKLAMNWLCCWGWPWISHLSASTSVCHHTWCATSAGVHSAGGLNLGLWYASRGPTELQPQPLYCHKIDMYCCYVPIDGSSLWPS